MPDKHSTFAPSSAGRWLACAGSVPLSRGLSDDGTEHTRQGTNAHALAEHCLLTEHNATEWIGRGFHPEGGELFEVSAEMADAVQVYLDYVRAIAGSRQVEYRVGDDVFGGTIDCLIKAGRSDLHVVDFKYGKTPVAVKDNPQLKCYGLLALDENPHATGVCIHIVQPRVYGQEPPQYYSRSELDAFGDEIVAAQNAAYVATKEDGPFIAGDHCQWCRAKAICPAQRVDFDKVAQLTPPDELGDDLTEILSRADQVRKYLKAVEAYAKRQIENGETVDGWKLVAGRGNRRWTYSGEGLFRRLRGIGIGKRQATEQTPLSPAQLKKAFPEHVEQIEQLCHRPDSAPRLVRDTAPGEVFEPVKPADVFTDWSFLD